ncbi:hypothetical protein TNCV_2335081 [Trichonephila clavipes]|uniref:Uncharacterized protein n=1 Tax=Trichonephila clavipes TaxID=2585209 RepID=A0A8X6SGH3_TRICX|nr:hypothetical protein TNCV_2335081 [Trichonephila clavipes]
MHIPIDVVWHRYTLNMQVSSGTKIIPPKRAILHHRNGVVQLCPLGGNGYLALSDLQTESRLVGKHHTRPLLWCPEYMLKLQVNRRRQ